MELERQISLWELKIKHQEQFAANVCEHLKMAES